MPVKKIAFVLISGLAVSLTSCMPFRPAVFHELPACNMPLVMTQTVFLPRIGQVSVDGNVHLIIQGHQLQNRLTLTAPQNVLSTVNIQQKNGTLTINRKSAGFGYDFSASSVPVYIKLDLANDIDLLQSKSNANIIAANIGYHNLKITLAGQTQAKITGNNLVLQQISAIDHAQLQAYWVNSTQINIDLQGQAKVFLSGVVTNLDVNAKKYAVLDGKYLHVKTGFIHTRDNARIAIRVNQALNVRSENNSTVYYFRDANFSDYRLEDSASVLRMQGISTL